MIYHSGIIYTSEYSSSITTTQRVHILVIEHGALDWRPINAYEEQGIFGEVFVKFLQVPGGEYGHFYRDIVRPLKRGHIHTRYFLDKKKFGTPKISLLIIYNPDGVFGSHMILDDIDEFCGRLVAMEIMDV